MIIEAGELTAAAEEILEEGARRVAKIYQTAERELWFIFREKKETRLFISAESRLAAIFLTSNKAEFPKTLPSFGGLLRKYLTGRALAAIDKKPNDRIIALVFKPEGYRLYCRLFGNGGFLLTDSDGKILGSSGFHASPPLKTGGIFTPGEPGLEGDEEKAGFKGSPSEVLEKRYRLSAIDIKRTALLSEIRKEIKKLGRLKKSLMSDRQKLLEYSECKKLGDICSAYFHKIPHGASKTVLPDPETGEDIEIKLTPGISPSENLQLLYKKYRKYKTGISRVEAGLAEAEKREKELNEEFEKILNSESFEDMENRSAKYSIAGTKKADRKKSGPSAPFRKFETRQGFEVLVGRNGKENDLLVKKSSGNDLWFHVRGFPGSHTVLKKAGKKEIPFDSILEAAKLALKYSTRAKDKKGTVVYTEIKNVKKPKKAPAGKVLITQEKTVVVSLD